MKKCRIRFFALALCLLLAGCGTADSGLSPAPEHTAAQKQDESAPALSTGPGEQDDDKGGSAMLVAVFSLAGEQYNVGVVEEGNTAVIAKMIAQQIGADLFEIEPVTPYPTTYNGLLDISRQEMNEGARPEIADEVEDMDKYDVVFLGYPNWWGDMPMIVYNFLESYDFSGKTIVPFCTNEGSGLSGTVEAIRDVTGTKVLDGLSVRGTTAQNKRDEAQAMVADWLSGGGFVE